MAVLNSDGRNGGVFASMPPSSARKDWTTGKRATYYVWRRASDGYVAATCYRPFPRRSDAFESLLVTQDWPEAAERIRAERKKDAS